MVGRHRGESATAAGAAAMVIVRGGRAGRTREAAGVDVNGAGVAIGASAATGTTGVARTSESERGVPTTTGTTTVMTAAIDRSDTATIATATTATATIATATIATATTVDGTIGDGTIGGVMTNGATGMTAITNLTSPRRPLLLLDIV